MPNLPGAASCCRRHFLKLGAAKLSAAVGLACLPMPTLARVGSPAQRELGFHNLHTGEKLKAVYWAEGRYLDGPLSEIDWLLRDFRTGEVKPIDRGLLDLLFAVRRELDSDATYEVVSGYRSPATNRMLARQGRRVARRSLHMEGLAVDVNLPGRRLDSIRRVAMALKRGGVGYYPRNGFVHLDVGRVRAW